MDLKHDAADDEYVKPHPSKLDIIILNFLK